MNQNKALELTKDIATDIIGGILIAVVSIIFRRRKISDGRGKRNRPDLLPVVWTADRYCCLDP